MRRIAAIASTTAALSMAAVAGFVLPSRSSELFVADARAGTARCRDQNAAVADGFRRVGSEFPAMGEHWVSLQRVMADSFAAAQPSVLTYVTVRGKPVLAGVAYTDLLERGEQPQSLANAHWHEHNGSVVEESFAREHAHGAEATDSGEIRLAVLHAWIWIDNPDGVFATDNWALAFARLETPPRRGLPPAAMRAVALAAGAGRFYADAVREGAELDSAQFSGALQIFENGEMEARRVITLATTTDSALEMIWNAAWKELVLELPHVRTELDALRKRLER